MATLSREATLPFSSLSPFSSGVNSERICSPKRKIFLLRIDPFQKGFIIQGSKCKVKKFVPSCKNSRKKHEDIFIQFFQQAFSVEKPWRGEQIFFSSTCLDRCPILKAHWKIFIWPTRHCTYPWSVWAIHFALFALPSNTVTFHPWCCIKDNMTLFQHCALRSLSYLR